MSRPQRNPEATTGHDAFIIGQALYCFVRAQQELARTDPQKCQWSDLRDAAAILRQKYPSQARVLVALDRAADREPALV
jgi:hypothetical protein